jgi:hypothetical protein
LCFVTVAAAVTISEASAQVAIVTNVTALQEHTEVYLTAPLQFHLRP